jgi:putative inorganic carbon (hco3(-)) transporter
VTAGPAPAGLRGDALFGGVGVVALAAAGAALAAVGARTTPLAMLLPLGLLLVPVLLARPVLAPVLVLGAIALGDVDLPGPLPLQLLDVVVLGVVGIVLLGRLADGLPPFPWVRPAGWAVALVGGAALSAAIAADRGAAVKQLGVLVGGVLLALAVVAVVERMDDIRLLERAIVAVGGAICAAALPSAGDLQSSYAGAVVDNRATSVFGDPNELGAFAAVVLVVAGGLWLAGRQRWERLLAAAGGTLALAALLLSLSRGAWLGAVVGTIGLAVLLPEARRRIAVLVVAAIGAAAVLLALAPGAPAEVAEERLGTLTSPGANPDELRPQAWRLAVDLIGEHPVLGIGPGGFVAAAEVAGRGEVSGAEHAHDLALTVGAEGGLVGVVLLAGLAVSLGTVTWRGVRSDPDVAREDVGLLAAPAAALLVFVGQGVVDFTFRNAGILVLAWMLVGLILAGARVRSISPTPAARASASPGP